MIEHIKNRSAYMLCATLVASLSACAAEIDPDVPTEYLDSMPEMEAEAAAEGPELGVTQQGLQTTFPLAINTHTSVRDDVTGCFITVTHGYYGEASLSAAYTSDCRCSIYVYSHLLYPYNQPLLRTSDVSTSCNVWNLVVQGPGYGGPFLDWTDVSMYNNATGRANQLSFKRPKR
jgi:hypothetical protein